MLTNAKIRIYPVGIFLLKVNNKNFKARCVSCSKLTKIRHQSNLTDIGTLRNVNIALVSSLLTLKRFHTFSQHFTVEFGECCWLGLPTGIKVQTSKNFETCKDSCKSYHINQTDQTTTWKKKLVSNLKSMQNVGFEQHIYEIYLDFCSVRITSLLEKKRNGNHVMSVVLISI